MRFTGLSEFLVYGLLFAAIIGFNLFKQVLPPGANRPAPKRQAPNQEPPNCRSRWTTGRSRRQSQ